MFREGDIVEIPLSDGRTAIGSILYISQHFKHAVGFIVFGIKGQLRDDYMEEKRTLHVLGPLYTHIDNLKIDGWKTIQHQSISESKRMLTKREVGGGVYVGDDYLGSVEELGEHDLRPMLFMGMPVIHKEIDKAFRNVT